jgi:hypothetical protein
MESVFLGAWTFLTPGVTVMKKEGAEVAKRSLRSTMHELMEAGQYETTVLAPDARVMGPYKDGFYALSRLPEGWFLGLRLLPQGEPFPVVESILLLVDRDQATGLTTGILRDVPLGEIMKNARRDASAVRRVISDEAAARVDEWLAPWRTGARGSRTKRPNVAYAALAARYVELVRQGERAPAATLARQLGVSAVTISQRIREARELGLLTRTTAGTAGGELKPKALSLLANPVFEAMYVPDDRAELEE